MSSSATAVDQLLCPEFSFSLDQLLTTSLMQQQQPHEQQQQMMQQQQQQPALRLPTGTCAAAAAAAASTAEATIAVDSWDAVAYMNDLDSEPRTCSLVPQLGGEVNFNVGGGGVLGSPVVNAAAAATFSNCGGINNNNNNNNFNLSFDFGGFEIVNPEVHQLGDNNHEEVEDEDDEDDDDESESTSAASPEVRQAKRQARQLQQLNQQQQEDFEPSQFTQELLNMSVRDMHQFLKKSNFTKEQVIQLKAERRRMKNRTYAKTARCKRKNRQGALESTVQQAQREQQELKGEVTNLRGELSLYKRKVAKAEQILRSHGLPIPW